MSVALRLARKIFIGVLLGALVLGAGGRVVMRLLAISIDRPAAFSLGGTLEVVAYGALLGAGGGLIRFVAGHVGDGRLGGMVIGLLTYGLALGTLPGHIAETAAPFAGQMGMVHMLFGIIFLAFGMALSWATSSSAFAKPARRH